MTTRNTTCVFACGYWLRATRPRVASGSRANGGQQSSGARRVSTGHFRHRLPSTGLGATPARSRLLRGVQDTDDYARSSSTSRPRARPRRQRRPVPAMPYATDPRSVPCRMRRWPQYEQQHCDHGAGGSRGQAARCEPPRCAPCLPDTVQVPVVAWEPRSKSWRQTCACGSPCVISSHRHTARRDDPFSPWRLQTARASGAPARVGRIDSLAHKSNPSLSVRRVGIRSRCPRPESLCPAPCRAQALPR